MKRKAVVQMMLFVFLALILSLSACRDKDAGPQAGNDERGREENNRRAVKVLPESSQHRHPQGLDSQPALNKSGRQTAGPFVIKEDGLYKIWYKEQLPGGKSHISYATSKDGIKWEKYEGNPVIEAGEGDDWDSSRAGPGKVLKIDGVYKMWYVGFDKNGISAIGHATSKDGIRWEKYMGNPVLTASHDGWDSKEVIAMNVMRDNGIYKMWYRGINEKEQAIGYATSKDGVRWEKYKNNPIMRPGGRGEWDSGNFVGDPHVIKKDGAYHMWYASLHNIGGKRVRETGYAASKDGIHWNRHEKNPVLRRGKSGDWDSVQAANVFVMFDEGIYKMWYMGSDGNMDAIGYATSKDGINLDKHKGNPVLAP